MPIKLDKSPTLELTIAIEYKHKDIDIRRNVTLILPIEYKYTESSNEIAIMLEYIPVLPPIPPARFTATPSSQSF